MATLKVPPITKQVTTLFCSKNNERGRQYTILLLSSGIMLQTLFLYPVAFPQLMKDSILIGTDGNISSEAMNKLNLVGLVLMFVGILALLIVSVMVKIYRVSLRRLAIVLPFMTALCFGAQLAICV